MTDDAGSYSSGGVGGGGGGNDWELVSLTASTYAAAPGPVLPHLPDAQKKTELRPPTPPAAVDSAIFMSQHFSLPAAESHTNVLDGCQEEEEESAPATLPRDEEGATDDLNIPCPENCEREQDGSSMTGCSDFHKDLSTTLGLDHGDLSADAGNAPPLPQGGGGVCFAGEERQATMLCSSAADAATDDSIDSATLPSHVVHAAVPPGSGVACVVAPNKGPSPRTPCEAQAWWNKTFRFLSSNSKESLTFRFIFVAATIVGITILGQRDKLQLRLEFNVDSEKISCGVSEPLALGQVKVSLLGGSPVAMGN